MRWRSFISLAVLVLVLDQGTKAAALALLDYHVPVSVFPGFNLTLGFNTGASFGMLYNIMADKPMVMAALTSALNGLSLRQRAIADNIANINTPDYHAKRVQFEAALAEGKAVAVVDGRIVENLHVETAKKTLARAEAIAAMAG